MSKQAVVYVVATPIGNLDDITQRALNTLKNVDLIAAEDTRNTWKLLNHFGITGKEMVSYHDHGEEKRAETLLDRIQREGLSLAIVSDAGTPCVADPGYRLVHMAKQRGVMVHPVPGPSAVTTLVSASGLPSDRFTFVGFLPSKVAERKREMESWKSLRGSIVFFEATRRLATTLTELVDIHPTCVVSVGRELTKLYEEIVTLPVGEALIWVESHASLKGEAVVMIGFDAKELEDFESAIVENAEHAIRLRAKAEFSRGKSLKDLLKEFAGCGLSRTDLYQLLLEVKSELDSD